MAEPYGPDMMIYNVLSAGGTNPGGERFGGRNYRVDLSKVECMCNVPQITHMPCSHMVAACRARGIEHKSPSYMSRWYRKENTLMVWQTAYEPYMDPTQWPQYNGFEYWPDPTLKKDTVGRRKRKRLRGVTP